MSVLLQERPALPRTESRRRRPARRAVARWAWRMFTREWRRQALVLALLTVAVAATTVGLGVASNSVNLKADPTFGTANTSISLPGNDTALAADLAAIRGRFGTVDVVAHEQVPVPGAVSTIDVRAEDPHGPYAHVTVRLDAGRYPVAPGEVAVTNGAAQLFGLHVGSTWQVAGRDLRVVGLVENPLDLGDAFALVPPSQLTSPGNFTVLVDTVRGNVGGFDLPSGNGLALSSRGTASKTAVEALVLVLATLLLLFVGLMAVAGFTVMAQRRLRALGMLGSLGATDSQVRLVLVADGAVVGATGAVVGAAVGLVAWLAFAPTLQSISGHRVDPLNLPWWAIGVAMLLACATAVIASWWPARAVARTSVIAALSGRPPRPQPAHRSALLGSVLLAAGIVLLAFTDRRRPFFIIGGTLATSIGLLLFAPLAVRALAHVSGRAPISVRLALRDLGRYQARSGAALGAVTLAIGIAATIVIGAASAQAPAPVPNLPASELMLYVTAQGPGSPVPPLSAAQLQTATSRVAQLGAALHARAVVPLEQAYDPQGGLQPPPPGEGGSQAAGYITPALAKVTVFAHGEEITSLVPLYVATPALLAHYGVAPSQISPSADVVTARRDLGDRQLFDPIMVPDGPGGPGVAGARPGRHQSAAGAGGPGAGTPHRDITRPDLQVIAGLPLDGSEPGALLTPHAMQALGLRPIPAAWLVDVGRPLTAREITTARRAAASTGLYVETKTAKKSLAPLRNWSTAAGMLIALGVLGMTVGLIRSETGNDLRVLTATGATSGARRTLTAATAGALAVLGALLGTTGAYAALFAWYRSGLSPLGRVPVANLALIVVALPAIAAAGGWVLAGREPSAIAARPLE